MPAHGFCGVPTSLRSAKTGSEGRDLPELAVRLAHSFELDDPLLLDELADPEHDAVEPLEIRPRRERLRREAGRGARGFANAIFIPSSAARIDAASAGSAARSSKRICLRDPSVLARVTLDWPENSPVRPVRRSSRKVPELRTGEISAVEGEFLGLESPAAHFFDPLSCAVFQTSVRSLKSVNRSYPSRDWRTHSTQKVGGGAFCSRGLRSEEQGERQERRRIHRCHPPARLAYGECQFFPLGDLPVAPGGEGEL